MLPPQIPKLHISSIPFPKSQFILLQTYPPTSQHLIKFKQHHPTNIDRLVTHSYEMVLKKITGTFKILITKNSKKKKKRRNNTTTSTPQYPSSSQTLAMSSSSNQHENHSKFAPFLFPPAQSTVLPDPTPFFPPSLLSKPLPTNSFFQNFVLKNGDQPEYIHPYLVKSSSSSLSVSYPSIVSNSAFLYQAFVPDLTISAPTTDSGGSERHLISEFDDLSVTLELNSAGLKFFLVRGSPYLTFAVSDGDTPITIKTIHAIISFSADEGLTKYTFKFNNGQTWFLYSSSAIRLYHDLSSIRSDGFSGIVRIAVLPDSDSGSHESVLDRFASCYPVSGTAVFTKPNCLEYVFEKRG